MFGYGAQVKRLERHDSKFEQMIAPFLATATGKMQNKRPADVADKSQGSQLDRTKATSCRVVLAEEQQPDSMTKLDVRPKELIATASAPTPAEKEYTMPEMPVPRALKAFFLWVQE